MKSIKRLMVVLSAQVNDFVDQIENHEAVAESALRAFRKDINEARFQAKCLERELKEVQTRKSKAEADQTKWTERAKSYGEKDKDKAIECVRRLKQAKADEKFLNDREAELEKVVSHLRSELQAVESRYLQMKQKHRMLMSRQQGAKLTGKLRGTGECLNDDSLHDVFERWEDKVTKSEIHGEIAMDSSDSFEADLEREEESLDLEATLDELISKDK